MQDWWHVEAPSLHFAPRYAGEAGRSVVLLSSLELRCGARHSRLRGVPVQARDRFLPLDEELFVELLTGLSRKWRKALGRVAFGGCDGELVVRTAHAVSS
eukprot:Sspe_Gene.43615::Locus_21290_Transcript_1_3_Confidence_0.400_Length_1666::g.43615::m.43615